MEPTAGHPIEDSGDVTRHVSGFFTPPHHELVLQKGPVLGPRTLLLDQTVRGNDSSLNELKNYF